MANLINIGVNGLLSHQSALNTTGNNITNANTPGYSRQRVELATLPEYRSGNGYMGQGSSVVGINRIVDQFLINQLRSDTSVSSQLDMLTTLYGQLDGLLADSSTGLAPALQGFFDALQQASLDPTSMPIRQVVLSAADTLAQRFGALYSQLQNQERVINEQLAAVTEQTVGLANGIARLNQQIAQQSSVGAEPNALLDKRDEMLRQLAELVGINVVDQGNGMVNVMVGNGQPLVVGNQAYSLSTQPSALDAHRDVIMFQGPGVQQEISQFLSGGQLGGLLRYRAEALDKSFNQLGQLALTVAEQFNALQISGMDLDGDYGSELPTLFADINSTELMQRRAVAIPGNTGDAQLDVAITDATALTGGEYRATMRSGSWVVTTEPGGDVVDPARHGFTLSERGTAANEGDSFLIRPTREGAGSIKKVMTDPRDLALAEPPLRITAGESNSGLAALEVVSSYPAPRPSSENIAALFSELKVSVGASGAVTLIVNGESVTGSLPPQGGVISLRYDEATDTYSLEADAFGDES
ncbi:MAG: flagellar hook-associated protein FlgK, partial [Spongiibacteraceae bacterium]|nr:flagellar hook-associated protein FlgK [Spongiibacteraceae bacterium]